MFGHILWEYSLKFRPYIGLIYGRYLQFRFLKWPLIKWDYCSQNMEKYNSSSKPPTRDGWWRDGTIILSLGPQCSQNRVQLLRFYLQFHAWFSLGGLYRTSHGDKPTFTSRLVPPNVRTNGILEGSPLKNRDSMGFKQQKGVFFVGDFINMKNLVFYDHWFIWFKANRYIRYESCAFRTSIYRI
jgi:hypothetical protein